MILSQYLYSCNDLCQRKFNKNELVRNQIRGKNLKRAHSTFAVNKVSLIFDANDSRGFQTPTAERPNEFLNCYHKKINYGEPQCEIRTTKKHSVFYWLSLNFDKTLSPRFIPGVMW